MKRIISLFLIVISLISLCSCSNSNTNSNIPSNKEYEETKALVSNYALALLKAWECGLNNDVILKDETVFKDFDNPKNVDMEQLVNVTGIEQAKIEEILYRDYGPLSMRTVNLYSSKFYDHETAEKVQTHNVLLGLNGIEPETSVEQYTDIITNIAMVKYLYEQVYKGTLDAKTSSNTDAKYVKLKELKNYVDTTINNCLNKEKYTNAFKSNYIEVSREINFRLSSLK